MSYRVVPCAPAANLSIGVLDYRTSEGGYLRLVPLSVAGSDGIASVELRQTPLVVRGREYGGRGGYSRWGRCPCSQTLRFRPCIALGY